MPNNIFEQDAHIIHYVETLQFGLIHLPSRSKAPQDNSWQSNPITTFGQAAQRWQNGGNIGLHHASSRTAVLDIDHSKWAILALAAVDIDLAVLLTAPGPKIRGAKGLKPVYRLPEGLELKRHSLAWRCPDTNQLITVLELRAGLTQDVLPPSIHPDTGKPYVWEPNQPQSRDDIPELPGNIRALWENWAVLKPVLDKAQPWAVPPPPRAYKDKPEVGSVISAFNERYTFSADNILEPYGYTSESPERWLSPHSSSGLAGVVLLKSDDGLERVYSHHGADLLGDGHAHDAFSAWCLLEHGGDITVAVREAAKDLGISYGSGEQVSALPKQIVTEVDTPEEPWAELSELPGMYPPVPALPSKLIPEPLRPWLVDIAERASLPLEFVTCPALVALSAVIGRKVGICPKRFDDWLVVPNLWGGIVGKPGVMKSAAISEPTKPLKELANKARERFHEEVARADAEQARLELEIAALKENEKRAAKGRYKS